MIISEHASNVQFQIMKNRERDEFNIAAEIVTLREQIRLLVEANEKLLNKAENMVDWLEESWDNPDMSPEKKVIDECQSILKEMALLKDIEEKNMLDEFYSYKANHAVKAHKALMEKINSV